MLLVGGFHFKYWEGPRVLSIFRRFHVADGHSVGGFHSVPAILIIIRVIKIDHDATCWL